MEDKANFNISQKVGIWSVANISVHFVLFHAILGKIWHAQNIYFNSYYNMISEDFPEANRTLLMVALGIPPPLVIAEARTGGDPSGNITTYTVEPSNEEDAPVMVKLSYPIRMVYWFTYCVSLLTTIGKQLLY